jgi:hypothetical protein
MMTELSDALLSYIRSAPNPAAPSLIDDYVQAHPEADPGTVRTAMMQLIRSGKITVGSGPRWAISV